MIKLIYSSERRLWKEVLEWEFIKEHEEANGTWSKNSEYLYQTCNSRWSIMWKLRMNTEGKTDIDGNAYEVEMAVKPEAYKLKKIRRTTEGKLKFEDAFKWKTIKEIEEELNI